MTTGTREYKSDFARRYYGQGKAEGKTEGKTEGKAEGEAYAVLAVLTARATGREVSRRSPNWPLKTVRFTTPGSTSRANPRSPHTRTLDPRCRCSWRTGRPRRRRWAHGRFLLRNGALPW
jgi:hypothetical protein